MKTLLQTNRDLCLPHAGSSTLQFSRQGLGLIQCGLCALFVLLVVGSVSPLWAAPIDTGPVTLLNFYEPGTHAGAAIIGGHSRHNTSGTFDAKNAFDGNTATDWATYQGTNNLLFLDLNLTTSGADSLVVDTVRWQNRAGSLDWVFTFRTIFSQDATFGNGDDVSTGALAVVGAGPTTFSVTPTRARYVRFQGIDTEEGYNPGAAEISLSGPAKQIDTGAIVLRDFFGPGLDLDATIIDGHSRYNTLGTFNAKNAFDGNTSTEWATYLGTNTNFFLDLALTAGAPDGVLINSMMWQDRAGALDRVYSIELIFSEDAVFDGSDIHIGPLVPNGANPTTFNFGEVRAKYVRFQGIDTADGYNPGAFEIRLFGHGVPEPSTFVLAATGIALGGLWFGWRRQRKRPRG